MKDIQKLKIWPYLEREGFKLKDYKENNILYGRGAILIPNEKEGFPFIKIEPLLNGRWMLTIDYYTSASSWQTTIYDIARILEKEIIIFKQKLNK